MKTLKQLFAVAVLLMTALPAFALPPYVNVTGASPSTYNGTYSQSGGTASTNYTYNNLVLGYDGSKWIIFASGSQGSASIAYQKQDGQGASEPAGSYQGQNGLGNGTATATDVTTPSLTAPSVSFGAATAGSLVVNWTVATGGTPSYTYQLYRAPDASGAPGTFAPVGPSTTSLTYSDTGLTGGTKYWYEVQATDSTSGSPQTATSAAAFSATVSLPQFAGLVSVVPQPAGDVVTLPGAVAGTNSIASASLYAGNAAGGESGSAVQTISSPVFPLAFAAQPAAAAGAAKYYVVKLTDSAGYSSAASNEVAVKASSLTAKGTTSASQTFVAAYGPAFTGLALGYTFYDSAGAVFARRSTAGVSELAGQGVYSAQPAIDAALLGAGYILWDAPSGTSAFTEPVSALAAAYLSPAITHNSSAQPVLTWAADSTATGYLVCRSVDNRATYQVLATLPASTLTYTDTARPATGTVFYHVVLIH